MRTLSSNEMKAVAGGDNPSMGPYAAPFTPEMVGKFTTAMGALLAIEGGIGGAGGFLAGLLGTTGGAGATVAVYNHVSSIAEAYNIRNGYDASGSNYSFPSGHHQPVSADVNAGALQNKAQDVIDCINNLGSGTMADILRECGRVFEDTSFLDQTVSYSEEDNSWYWSDDESHAA